MIVILCTYLFYQKFLKDFGDDALSLAELAAQKNRLEAEIAQCQKWLQDNREELLKLEAERRDQALLQQELARLQMELTQTDQRLDDQRKEAK